MAKGMSDNGPDHAGLRGLPPRRQWTAGARMALPHVSSEERQCPVYSKIFVCFYRRHFAVSSILAVRDRCEGLDMFSRLTWVLVWGLLHLFTLNLKVGSQTWLLPGVCLQCRNWLHSPTVLAIRIPPPPSSASPFPHLLPPSFLLPPPPPCSWCKLNCKVSSSGFLIQSVLLGTWLFGIHSHPCPLSHYKGGRGVGLGRIAAAPNFQEQVKYILSWIKHPKP